LRHWRSHHVSQEGPPEQENALGNSSLLLGDLDMSGTQREIGNENVAPPTSLGTGGKRQIHMQGEPRLPSLPQSTIGSNHTPYMTVDTGSTIHSTPPTTLFSTEGSGDSATQDSLEPALWDSRIDPGWTSWLTGVDFDLDAVNTFLLQGAYDPGSHMTNYPDGSNVISLNDPETSHENDTVENLDSTIQRKWHTYFERPASGTLTPNGSQGRSRIDETYRGRLTDSLQQRVQNGILPSTAFLV
jgi:hypothetical protein